MPDYNDDILNAQIVRNDDSKIEVRIKTFDNVFSLWGDIKPVFAHLGELDAIRRFIGQYEGVCEIRWNYVGSGQGHYVQANNPYLL